MVTYSNLAQALDENGVRIPGKACLVFEDRIITYKELNEMVNKAGNALLELGVRKQDRVIISLLNCPEFVISLYALAKIGAIAVPINYFLAKSEEEYVWRDSGAGLIITDADKVAQFYEMTLGSVPILRVGQQRASEALPGVIDISEAIDRGSTALSCCAGTEDDVAHILYTSGTTGKPKGAMLTHSSVMYCSSLYTDNDNMGEMFGEKDKVLCSLPLYHCFGQNVCLITPLSAGSTVILVERFNTEKVLEAITRHGATLFAGVPTMYAYMAEGFDPEKHNLQSLRYCLCAGAALSLEIAKGFEEKTGAQVIEGYGITEASAQAIAPPLRPDKRRYDKFGTIGIPLKNSRKQTEVKVVDENGGEVPLNEIGELIIKGDHIMKGYWNLPEETAKTIRDGWLYTGDLAKKDEDGFFSIVDRKKDMLIVGGENVYPREVEEVLYENEKVLETAVVGMRDEAKGEIVKAVIVLKDGVQATRQEIMDFCSERLAKFKVPRIIEFVEELPKSTTGKILRRLVK
jgi:long-chain acyl-CoA synthetase